MTTGRFSRRPPAPPPSPAVRVPPGYAVFALFIAVSLVLHGLLAWLLLLQIKFIPWNRPQPTVTMAVDLVAPPVLHPRRGAGGATPDPVSKPAASVPATVTPAPERTTVVSAPTTKTAGASTGNASASDDEIRERLNAIRQKQQDAREQDNVADAIASLQRARAQKAAAGAATGSGNETGSAIEDWLRQALRDNWQFSKYQVEKYDLRARVEIEFDAQGRLLRYTLVEPSRDANFNDSLRRAIHKLKPLPQAPGKPWRDIILFTLEDLQGD